jgi:hypothetical protein
VISVEIASRAKPGGKVRHQMTSLLSSNIMPRTTLDLDATVLEELRRRATGEGKSMGQVASEVLAGGLHERNEERVPPLAWPRRPMGRFKIDLEDKEALWRLLDREELERGSG